MLRAIPDAKLSQGTFGLWTFVPPTTGDAGVDAGQPSPGDAGTADDGGPCGHVCGQAQYDDPFCDGGACDLTCQGEHYDVNGDPSDGCEVEDSPTGNHTQATATNEGASLDCSAHDSQFYWTGEIPSDRRIHTNAPSGFSAVAGAAPDWFSYVGNGEQIPFVICVNGIVATLAISGSVQPNCYELTIQSDENLWAIPTDASGVATRISSCTTPLCSDYSSGSTIYFEVSKTCSVFEGHLVTYTLAGHL